MDRRVTLRELLIARIVLAICIAVYYWCWARNGWENYFSSIQTTVATFAFLFFCFLGARERKYKKEVVDEMAAANQSRYHPSLLYNKGFNSAPTGTHQPFPS